ncbi:MAG TPA: bifunctional diguanylate cyclase/phosphodiesterase [Planctomycetota bacterium]|nr:bifunctional diguanylate cyclase/phosphodiesterase [Planctomycetota bacterium]
MGRPEHQPFSDDAAVAMEAFDRLLDQHPDPAWIYEMKGLRLLKVNAALSLVTEYTRDELVRMRLKDLRPEAAARPSSIEADSTVGLIHGTTKEFLTLRSRSGKALELIATSHSLDTTGGIYRLVIARRAEAPLPAPRAAGEKQSGTRTYASRLAAAVKRKLSRLGDAPDRKFAILIIEVDRLKTLQRNFGQDGADQLLAAVGKRLSSLIHSDESLIPLDNGRFGMVLEGGLTAESALHMAREIQGELEAPFTVSGQELEVTASIGAALGGPETGEAAELIRNAEYALDGARAQGMGGRRVFAQEMRAREAKDLRMEQDLRPGIERGELRAYYQPIVSLPSGKVAGFEALARWHHPVLGVLMPAQFIPMAETTGIIVDLGKRMMLEACRQVCEWQSRFRTKPPLFVTVNCSPSQFVDPRFATVVQWALVNSGLAPDSLKLELTETILMEDDQETLHAIDRVLKLGVKLIIDDFGTGYSSLSRLHRLPIESLKIDRSFVSGLVDAADSQTMTRVILQMARNFNLRVTAEGVENADQLRILRGLNCDFAQGYLFSRAMEPEQAEALMTSGQSW